MRIELDKLPEDRASFAHVYTPDEFSLEEEHARLRELPKVTGRISRIDQGVLIDGQISAVAELDCDRCLKSVGVPVETKFNVSYVTPAVYESAHEAELQDQDLGLSIFDGETIDVDELVREQLLLALPARALCRDECKGLCPICGKDRNLDSCECQEKEIDPRWAGLENLVNRK